jgi:hypothetical protein
VGAGGLISGKRPDAMYHSDQILAKLPTNLLYPDTTTLQAPSTIGDEKKENHYLKIRSLEEWRNLMG